MRICIDASNIKAGGGLTHLKRILQNYDSNLFEVELFGGVWLDEINHRRNLNKNIYKIGFSNFIIGYFFKNIFLKKKMSSCDIIFSPGANFFNKNLKYITVPQNMLVFEQKERDRFPFSLTWLRYLILEKSQYVSLKNSNGIIYLSNYAKNYIEEKYPRLRNISSRVIYHGISDDFRQRPKKQYSIDKYTEENPYIITYVSIVNYYKHQHNVINAVKELKNDGYSIELRIVGPIIKSLKEDFKKLISGSEYFIKYYGNVEYNKISNIYKKTDLFVFASTCENMPNILVEAMSAGLPILCSSYGPMPEILRDGGKYMDPTSVNSIIDNFRILLKDKILRKNISEKAYKYSKEFSWKKTSKETFDFIRNLN